MHGALAQNFLLADTTPLMQWVFLGIALVGTAIVLFRPKYREKKDPLNRSPDAGRISQERAVERQMQNLLVELSEMARQITAGLDTRAGKLDALIREADEKIARLESLRQQMPNSNLPQMPEPESPPPPVQLPPNAYDPDPRHVEVYVLADQGQTASQIAAQLGRPNGEIELILALRPRK